MSPVRAALSALLAVLGACAHHGAPPSPPAAQPMSLDGTVVLAEPDPLTRLEFYGPDELFHVARELETAGRLDAVRVVYQRLIDEFPDSGWATPSRFNLGLVHEQAKEWGPAANLYLAIASREQPPADAGEARRTWIDAHYRLAVCYGKLADWWRAVAVFDHLLALHWLEDGDRLEALVGRGIAIDEGGDAAGAEIAFAAAMRFHRDAEARSPLLRSGLVAEAAFRMGQIAQRRYEAEKLEFPLELLKARLEKKCEQLLSAQSRYLQAIRHGDAHTIAAAGFRIGSLYETLYDAVVELAPPAELTAEQALVYNEEVRQRVSVLLEKSIRIYEKALLAGRRAPTAQDWVGRLEAAVARVRSLYLATPLPAAASETGGGADSSRL